MAEMSTLLATIYRRYTTEPRGDFDAVSPGITSRFEVFYDEGCSGVRVSLPQLYLGLDSHCVYRNMNATLNSSLIDIKEHEY